MQSSSRPVLIPKRRLRPLERLQQVKDKNIAVRVTWQTWQALENLRSNLEAQKKKKTTLSEIVREVLEDHSGTNDKSKHSDR